MRKNISKEILVAVIMLGLIIGSAPAFAAGTIPVTINAPSTVFEDSDFTASISIGEVTDLNALQYDITFDADLLRLDNISQGQIGGKIIPVMSNMLAPGKWRIVQLLGLETVNGSGTISSINFHVTGSVSQSGNISLSDVILSGISGQIPATWNAVSVSVVASENPPPNPLVPPNTENPAPVETTTTLVDQTTVSTQADTSSTDLTVDNPTTMDNNTGNLQPVPTETETTVNGLEKNQIWYIIGGVAGAVILVTCMIVWLYKIKMA